MDGLGSTDVSTKNTKKGSYSKQQMSSDINFGANQEDKGDFANIFQLTASQSVDHIKPQIDITKG